MELQLCRRAPARRSTLLTISCLCVAGVGVSGVVRLGGERELDPKVVSADYFFPASDARDWIGYADSVVLLEVVTEEERAPITDSVAEGESYAINRELELRVISILWDGPARSRPALVEGDSLSILTSGWWVNDKGRAPLVLEGATRLEVGAQYVTALLYDGDGQIGRSGWTLLAPSAVAAFDTESASADLPGLGTVPLGDISMRLDNLEVPRYLTNYMDLDPFERVRAAVTERDGPPTDKTDAPSEPSADTADLPSESGPDVEVTGG